MITADRYHDISVGHRVHGHESKCAHLHGHNYRIHFKVAASPTTISFGALMFAPETDPEHVQAVQAYNGLDDVGRVLDFSVIKSKLCMWLEDNWDHKFLAWEDDTFMNEIHRACASADSSECSFDASNMLGNSLVWTPFNPTAENMAEYLLRVIGPQQLLGTGCQLIKVTIEETRKCSASASL